MSTKAEGIAARLAELEAAVAGAEQNEIEVRAARGRARRRVDGARAAEAAHHEAVAAGDVGQDAAREAALEASVREAEVQAAEHVWSAKATGAERGTAQRKAAAGRFVVAHFADLAAEEALMDGPARDRLQAAWAELDAAEEGYSSRIRAWHRLARYGVIEGSDVPSLPTRGGDDEVRGRFARGIEAPTPRFLLAPEGGPDKRRECDACLLLGGRTAGRYATLAERLDAYGRGRRSRTHRLAGDPDRA